MTVAQDFQGDALYKELGEAGRPRMALTPGRLTQCDALLACPEVIRRAKSLEASTAQLADAAYEALHAAVKSLQTGDEAYMGQAIFGFGDFGGKTVTLRKARLEKAPYLISAGRYKELRPIVLREVIHYLKQKQPTVNAHSPIDESELGPSQSHFALENVAQMIARLGARLHYDLLTSIYVNQFAFAHSDNFTHNLYHPHEDGLFVCCNRTQATYVDLASTLSYYLGGSEGFEYVEKDWPRDGNYSLEAFLPTQGLTKLRVLAETIREDGPAFTDEQWVILHSRQFGLRITDYEPLESVNVFVDTWATWFYERDKNPSMPGDPPRSQALVAMAKTSAEVTNVISQYTSLYSPVFREARRTAYKTLAYCYDFDESEPLFQGASFHQMADKFFDAASDWACA